MANTWYIDPVGGSNGNGGTSEVDAVETFVYAHDTLAAHSDTVTFMDGIYDDAQFPASIGKRLTLKSLNSRGAYINRLGSASSAAFIFGHSSPGLCRVEGFKINLAPHNVAGVAFGGYAVGAWDFYSIDNWFESGSLTGASVAGCITLAGNVNVANANLTVQGGGVEQGDQVPVGHFIDMGKSYDDLSISDVYISGSSGNLNYYFIDHYWQGGSFSGGNVTIDSCEIRGSSLGLLYLRGGGSNNPILIQRTLFETNKSLATHNADWVGEVTCYNNTIIAGTIFDSISSDPSSYVLRNNIFVQSLGNSYMFDDTGGGALTIDSDYNDWWVHAEGSLGRISPSTYTTLADWQAITGSLDPNSISENPKFTNVDAGDYTLKDYTSPAVDAGLDIGLPFNSTAPDLGYWESLFVSPTGSAYGYYHPDMTITNPGTGNRLDIAWSGSVAITGSSGEMAPINGFRLYRKPTNTIGGAYDPTARLIASYTGSQSVSGAFADTNVYNHQPYYYAGFYTYDTTQAPTGSFVYEIPYGLLFMGTGSGTPLDTVPPDMVSGFVATTQDVAAGADPGSGEGTTRLAWTNPTGSYFTGAVVLRQRVSPNASVVFTSPVDGTNYVRGQVVGDSTVIYSRANLVEGDSVVFLDKDLSPKYQYHYAVYTHDRNFFYTSGSVVSPGIL